MSSEAYFCDAFKRANDDREEAVRFLSQIIPTEDKTRIRRRIENDPNFAAREHLSLGMNVRNALRAGGFFYDPQRARYHNTHDQKHVQMLLGHRSILSTDRYITIENAIFNDVNDEFHVKIASTLEEATKLLEVGFEYIVDIDGKKLFRKRK
jgi:hypothetical protein